MRKVIIPFGVIFYTSKKENWFRLTNCFGRLAQQASRPPRMDAQGRHTKKNDTAVAARRAVAVASATCEGSKRKGQAATARRRRQKGRRAAQRSGGPSAGKRAAAPTATDQHDNTKEKTMTTPLGAHLPRSRRPLHRISPFFVYPALGSRHRD